MTIVGPLFWKELVETARPPRYYAARLVVGPLLVFVLWLFTLAHKNLAVLLGRVQRRAPAPRVSYDVAPVEPITEARHVSRAVPPTGADSFTAAARSARTGP